MTFPSKQVYINLLLWGSVLISTSGAYEGKQQQWSTQEQLPFFKEYRQGVVWNASAMKGLSQGLTPPQ